MRLTPDVHCAVDDASWKHNFDCRPEQLLEATKDCDKVDRLRHRGPVHRHPRLAGGRRRVRQAALRPVRRLVLGRSQRPGLRRAAGALRERPRPARAEARADLPELRPAGPEAPAAVQEGGAARHPDQLAPGDVVRPARAAEVLEPDPAGRHRRRLPRPADDHLAHGPPVGDRVRRADPQAPATCTPTPAPCTTGRCGTTRRS